MAEQTPPRTYETPPTDRPITEAEAARSAGLAHNEHLKIASGYLRGTLADGLLKHATGAISEDDGQLVKFHGMYMQDDRDIRAERTKKKLEKAFSFMIRLRIAGGVVTPKQWLALDEIATTYAGGALRATTRQTFQYHGVIKSNLKRTMAAIDSALPSVSCTWLRVIAVTGSQGGARVALTGVAGNPGAAQQEIDRTLQAQGLRVNNIDFAEVSPITQSGCAALDAFRQVRNPAIERLSVPQRRFEMRLQPPGSAYAGRVAANAVINIAIGDPGLDFALVGLEPSGKIDMVIPNRAAFEQAVAASKNGAPITALGNDRYRLQIDLDHVGWSGLLLVTGKGPFAAEAIAPPLGQRGADWREQLVTLAAERGWQTDMVWFRSVDDVRE